VAALGAALAPTRRTGIALVVAGGSFLAVDAHSEVGDLERESTALRLWAAAYRFNPLCGLLAGDVVGA
jgi:hypothetical protein